MTIKKVTLAGSHRSKARTRRVRAIHERPLIITPQQHTNNRSTASQQGLSIGGER